MDDNAFINVQKRAIVNLPAKGVFLPQVLIVTSNGSPPDYVHTNKLLGLELHSTPQYKPGQTGPDLG